jgi:hypothetical protein
MDVHKDTVMVAVFEDRNGAAEVEQQLPNDARELRRFFERWGKRGEIRGCYEASGPRDSVARNKVRDPEISCSPKMPAAWEAPDRG